MATAHGRIDPAALRVAVGTRWPEILGQLGGLPEAALDGRHHPCPKCGGSDRFRLIDGSAGAVLCNQCFNESNGDGFAALQWLTGKPFPEVLQEVADAVGYQQAEGTAPQPATRQSKSVAPAQTTPPAKAKDDGKPAPDSRIDWGEWHGATARLWAGMTKPGIAAEAPLAFGGRMGVYRKRHDIIGLPILGEKLDPDKPAGWVILSTSANPLPSGPPDNITWLTKPKVTYGSRRGLIADPARLRAAKVVWKCEGITDALALHSLGLPPDHAVVTNSNGTSEKPQAWVLDAIGRGKVVYVIHDADKPGQAGAVRWASKLAEVAGEVRNVQLPGQVEETHGRDVRDWINDGGDLAKLLALAEAAEVVRPGDDAKEGDGEAPDDPFRLARLNLDRYAQRTGGRTLRYWVGSWWIWRGDRYVAVSEEEIRAKIGEAVKKEFDALGREAREEFRRREQAGQTGKDERPPYNRKVTPAIIASVLAATKSLTYVSGLATLQMWLPTKEERPYISMANGLLDVDSLVAGQPEGIMQPHSPDWFSTVHFPYGFDSAAECPTWREFLAYNLKGEHDAVAFLQEWFGYLLLPDTGEQQFLIMVGEGANGKSVCCGALEAMLGETNCSAVPLESFGDRFSKTATVGKLVNICGDVGEIDAVAEGQIKAFTSGNRMMFDRKGKTPLECRPTARLMIACNVMPRMRDRTSGTWRRVMVMPWNVTVPVERRVKNMDKAAWWTATGELPGILNWALAGLHRLREQGRFTEPAAMGEAKAAYQLECNPTKAFLGECIERRPGSELVKMHLYATYRAWCERHGCRPLGHSQFAHELGRHHPGLETVYRRDGGCRKRAYVHLGYTDSVEQYATTEGAYLGFTDCFTN